MKRKKCVYQYFEIKTKKQNETCILFSCSYHSKFRFSFEIVTFPKSRGNYCNEYKFIYRFSTVKIHILDTQYVYV